MNLRLFVFLTLGALSSVASANWFDDYQIKTLTEVSKPIAAEVEVDRHAATMTQSYPNAAVDVYSMLETPLPKAVLAPSFDVVAREMEQIKEKQVSEEYALITYLQKNNVISVE